MNPQKPHSDFVFDAEYVRGLQARAPGVTAHFLAHFTPLLNVKLRCALRCGDQVEDLRQETFRRVFEAINVKQALRDPARLPGFVAKVCQNVTAEYLRRRTPAPPECVTEPEDPHQDAEQLMLRELAARIVRDTMQRMCPRDREVLLMIFFEGADREAVSARFGVRADHVRLVIHRALARMRKEITIAHPWLERAA